MWWPLVVPLLALGILMAVAELRKQVAWWEPLLMFGPTALICLLMVLLAESTQTHDTEWCTQKCVKVEHHEKYVREWEEYVPEQGHTDSDGNYVVDVPAHWETVTEHHPEHWEKIGENGKSYGISGSEYQRIVGFWNGNGGKEVFTDLRHSDQRHRFGCPKGVKCNCSDGRGDMFHVTWPRSHHTIEAITWCQTWENRVQACKETLFRFPEVPEERAKELYELPKPDGNWNTPCILGQGGPTQVEANKELVRQNALLGPRSADGYAKAVRMWILLYNNSQSDDDALDQENLWKGGNKNEFTLCIGLDSKYHANWAYVISWTDAQKVKIDVRDFVMHEFDDKPIDLNKVVAYMSERCRDDFLRKHSAEFSYLTIRPPTWALVVCWIITILVNGGVGAFVVLNDFTTENPHGESRYSRFRSRFRR